MGHGPVTELHNGRRFRQSLHGSEARIGRSVEHRRPRSSGASTGTSPRRSDVKALSIANFVYGLLFAWGAYTEIKILIDHLTGQASAPWILLPARLAMIVFETCMPFAAAGGGFRFFQATAVGPRVRAGVRRLLVHDAGARAAHQVRAQARRSSSSA